MAIRIENSTRNCIRDALAIFKSVRRPTLTKLVEMINTTKSTSEQLVNMEVNLPQHRKVSSTRDHVINSSQYEATDYAGANAFEAYVALLAENEQAVENFSEIMVSKGKYPYNFVATIEDTINLILVYDASGSRRLAHHNRSAELRDDEAIILVIPYGYTADDIGNIRISGNYRIAMINIKDPERPICVLSDTIKGER